MKSLLIFTMLLCFNFLVGCASNTSSSAKSGRHYSNFTTQAPTPTPTSRADVTAGKMLSPIIQ